MLGKDVQDNEAFNKYQALARYFAEEHIHTLDQSLQRVISANQLSVPPKLIGAGAGRFLVAKLALRHNYKYMNFEQMLNVEKNQQALAADCATAVSVAQLMRVSG